MKIIIKAEGYNIRLWFPLSVLKSRIGYTVVKNAIEHNANKNTAKHNQIAQAQSEQIKIEIKKEISLNRDQMVKVYNFLKRYVNEHGHFNILEIYSHDGEKVIIRV